MVCGSIGREGHGEWITKAQEEGFLPSMTSKRTGAWRESYGAAARYRVMEAASSEEAIYIAPVEEPDQILMDLRL